MRKAIVRVTKEKEEITTTKDEIIERKSKKIDSLRRRLKRRMNGNDSDDTSSDENSIEDSSEDSNDEDDRVMQIFGSIDSQTKNGPTLRRSSEEIKSVDVRLNFALGMIAIRWNGKIVAEKGSIIVAALIANVFFRDLSGFSVEELAIVAAMFFIVEIMTDSLLTFIMDHHFNIPILSASPKADLFSKQNVVLMVLVGLQFISMNACIAMAASVEL